MAFIVKNTTFPGLLDLVSPHSCRGCGRLGEPFCECCKNYILKSHADVCPQCKTSETAKKCPNCPNLPLIYVVAERNGLLGEVIHDFKYYSIRALARPLAELIDSVLPSDLDSKKLIIVPLPTATHHVRARGLDHTHLIAKNLAKIRGCSEKRLLTRDKNTVQVGSDRSKRLTQAENAYTINPKFKIDSEATYLLLDDIWTTGASVKAACNKLQTAGAKDIRVALLAYSS